MFYLYKGGITMLEGNGILRMKYFTDGRLTSYVEVDTDKKKVLKVENYSDDPYEQFFAFNISNDWEGFVIMMEDRMMSPRRQDLPQVLESMGLFEYDLLEMIKANGGRIYGEPFHIEFV